MKKLYYLYLFVLLMVLTLVFSACNADSNRAPSKDQIKTELAKNSEADSNRAPSKDQIKTELAKNSEMVATIGNTGLFAIEDIDITLADTENDIYTADIVVTLENNVYSIRRETSVTYKKYDVGGWVLMDVSNIHTTHQEIIGPYPEEAALKNAQEKYDNVKLESHKTDLENKTDIFTFSSTYKGKYFDYTITFEEVYMGNGGWYKADSQVLETDSNLHLIDGLYCFSFLEEGRAIHFNNDGTITILFEEWQDEAKDGTAYLSHTITPTYEFDAKSLTYVVKAPYYNDFIIAKDEISYLDRTLRETFFFDVNWLREKHQLNCIKFIQEDKKRHSDEYAQHKSSTINEKDLYGIWQNGNYQYEISETGLRYRLKTGEWKNIPDWFVYGYDSEKKAYIVYFCRRKYTTSTYYVVSHVETLEFIKTDSDTVELQNYNIYSIW